MQLNIWVQRAEPWAMLEVFLLGFIVSLLKLGHVAELHFGIGLWALIALVICMSAAIAGVDRRELWDRLELVQFKRKEWAQTQGKTQTEAKSQNIEKEEPSDSEWEGKVT